MKPNVGSFDAGIRWVLAAVLFLVAVSVSSLLGSSLAALGAFVMAGTAFTHRCPMYVALGLDTRGSGPPAPAR